MQNEGTKCLGCGAYLRRDSFCTEEIFVGNTCGSLLCPKCGTPQHCPKTDRCPHRSFDADKTNYVHVMHTTTLKGYYCKGDRTVSTCWDSLSGGHAHEFPQIKLCVKGTFNVKVSYTPPNDEKYRKMAKQLNREDGNHISPCAKITQINNQPINCWIYRGGHVNEDILELLSEKKLSEYLNLKLGDDVAITIEEVEEGTVNMPSAPFKR